MYKGALKLSVHNNNSNNNAICRLSGALIPIFYAYWLQSLPFLVLSDRINYLNYAQYSLDKLLWNIVQGPLAVFSNEPLWLLLNSILSFYFQPEAVVRIIIFSSAFTFSYLALRENRKYLWWVIFFLFMPQIIVHWINALRQGVAIAVFLAGWYSSNKKIKSLLFLTTVFIHTSFFFVLSIYFLSKLLVKFRLAVDIRTLAFICFSIAISFSVGWLAMLLQVRQAQQYVFNNPADISGLGFLFWSFILFLMYLQGKSFLRTYVFEVSGLIFYLISYWMVPVSARIFESILFFVLIAGLKLNQWRGILFRLLIISYFLGMYIMRIDEPMFGFGVKE